MTRRPWTADRIVVEKGERIIHQSPKRLCTKCQLVLGDMTDAEIAAHGLKQKQRASHDECPRCLGFHVLSATVVPYEPDATETMMTIRLLCPGKPEGFAVEPCAEWVPCGCRPPAGVMPLTVEWEQFLAGRCPGSLTGEHRHLADLDGPAGPVIAAAKPGTCFAASWWLNQLGDRPPSDFVGHIIDGPGVYPVEIDVVPVEIDVVGQPTLSFKSMEVFPHRRAVAMPV